MSIWGISITADSTEGFHDEEWEKATPRWIISDVLISVRREINLALASQLTIVAWCTQEMQRDP